MKYHNAFIAELMVGILVVAFLAPAASAIEVEITGGDAENVFSAATGFGSDARGSILQKTSLSPKDGIENHISFSGSLSLSRSIRDTTNGDYAAIYASVSGVPGWTYGSYDYSLSKTTGVSVTAQEWLNAYYARSITAYSTSENSEGDHSQALASAYSPSYNAHMQNFYTYAFASPTQAYTSLSADYIRGSQVKLDTHSWNAEGDEAEAYTFVENGVVSSPNEWAQAGKDYARARVMGLKADAPYGTIHQRMYADNSINASYVQVFVDEGYLLTYPYSSSYPAYSYASKEFNYTRATQSEYVFGYYPTWAQSYTYLLGTGELKDEDTYASGYRKIGQHAFTQNGTVGAWNTILP